ncbi:hypothetical protein, partial [Salmonella sp. CQ23WZ0312SAL]|uniref:hypothetical protein n=1 Tax=Salmonella sp. CQ23WZ0312SAL TaxID=3417710 RepID=UPI003D35CC43
WEGWAILLRQKQKKLIMLPSETMIWQPEFTDKTLSRKPGAVHDSSREIPRAEAYCRTDAQALCLLPFWLSSSCELYVILLRDDFYSDWEAFPFVAAHILFS